MKHDEPRELSLEQLAETVQERLRDVGLLGAAADGRVSDAPDARTVRYYTTLGLLDRPRIVDRQARYGARQVRQLLAIKALQAESCPLAEIQERLYGRSDAELDALLASARPARPERAPAPPAVVWREVTIAPGLKLAAQDGWAPGADAEALVERIRAALTALAPRSGDRS